MVVSDSISVVAETTEVGLGALLLFDCHSHNFDLNKGCKLEARHVPGCLRGGFRPRTCWASRTHPFQLNHSSFVAGRLGPGSRLAASSTAATSVSESLEIGNCDLHPSGPAERTGLVASAVAVHQRTSPGHPAVTLLPCQGPSTASTSATAYRLASSLGAASSQEQALTSSHQAPALAASTARQPPLAPAFVAELLRFRSYLNQTCS